MVLKHFTHTKIIFAKRLDTLNFKDRTDLNEFAWLCVAFKAPRRPPHSVCCLSLDFHASCYTVKKISQQQPSAPPMTCCVFIWLYFWLYFSKKKKLSQHFFKSVIKSWSAAEQSLHCWLVFCTVSPRSNLQAHNYIQWFLLTSCCSRGVTCSAQRTTSEALEVQIFPSLASFSLCHCGFVVDYTTLWSAGGHK